MEKEKKKRIFEILKKIGIAIVIIIGFIILINSCAKKTKAEEIQYNYRNYNIIASIESSDLVSDHYVGQLTVIATIQDNNIIYVSIDDSYPDYDAEESILLSGPYETYGAENIETGKIYFLQTEEDYPNSCYTIIGASEINTFYNWFNGEMYTSGYASGTDTTNPNSPYNKGIADGKQQQQIIDNQTLEQTIQSYETQIETLNEAIQELTTNNGGTSWMSFKNLLGLIFMYPIRFLKEGMDVNIWGVNIGGLILGLLMIGVTVTIIGIILGKRTNS